MTVWVTGAAGFVGAHTAAALLAAGLRVHGIDNLSDFYDPALKEDRVRTILEPHEGFRFHQLDCTDAAAMNALAESHPPTHVVHLAAQAGVRHSLTHPRAYIDSNIVGFLNVLEICRHAQVAHLVYASSSSVYGTDAAQPFRTSDRADRPINLYAATKRSNELMAHAYTHLYAFPATGLRFFTVYGPWGRPDMAIAKFTKAIAAGAPIDVYNGGDMRRDFTYVDDIVGGVLSVFDRPPAQHAMYNLGCGVPVPLLELIATRERHIGRKAQLNFLPMQPGDVHETYACVDELREATGYVATTSLDEGIRRYVEWFKSYY
ncbi:MAG: NAD-dependent epimerase/dehydratase family protein [Myxococcota bacterium]